LSLGVILLVIWATNIHSFIKLSSGDSPVRALPQIKTEEMAMDIVSERKDTFRANFRDPFSPQINRRIREPHPTLKPRVKEKKDPFNNLQLIGIIENRAVIKNSHDGVHFSSVGDTIGGFRVLSVGKDSVAVGTLGAHGQRKTFKITYSQSQ